MAKHVWTVFCSKFIEDSSTKTVTLVEVLEGLTIDSGLLSEDDPVSLPQACCLVTTWARSDSTMPEAGDGFFRFLAPDRTELVSGKARVVMSETLQARVVARFPQLILKGTGVHVFEVSYRRDGDEEVVTASISVIVARANRN